MYHVFSVHLPANGHEGSFSHSPIVNKFALRVILNSIGNCQYNLPTLLLCSPFVVFNKDGENLHISLLNVHHIQFPY
jgi:hypothetical protein